MSNKEAQNFEVFPLAFEIPCSIFDIQAFKQQNLPKKIASALNLTITANA